MSGDRRTGILFPGGLIAAVCLGSWSCCSAPYAAPKGGSPGRTAYECPEPPHNHAIFVFDDGSVTEECARISQSAAHKIVWLTASADSPVLSIDLVVRRDQKVPFKKLQCGSPDPNGDRVCRMDCKKDRCNTGPYADDYRASPLGDYYKYYPGVKFAAGPDVKGADPGMIIDP